MYKSHVVSLDYWRNFVPEAPDFNVQVRTGVPTPLLLNEILIQGAVDFNVVDPELKDKAVLSPLPTHTVVEPPDIPKPIDGRYTLAEIATQRGWHLFYDYITPSKYGNIVNEQWQQGFEYKALNGYEGFDCVDYIVSNGSQKSFSGKIHIESIRWHDLDVKIIEHNPGKYEFITTHFVPPTSSLYWYSIQWYTVGPYVEFNSITNRDEVKWGKQKIAGTVYTSNYGYWYYIIEAETIRATITSDAGINAFDPRINAPYKPTGDLPDIFIEYTVWPKEASGPNHVNSPDWAFKYEQQISFNTKFHGNWWESGYIEKPYLEPPAPPPVT